MFVLTTIGAQPNSGRMRRGCLALAATLIGFWVPQGAIAKAKPKVLVFEYQPLAKGMPDDLGEATTAVVTREIAHGEVKVVRPAADRPSKKARRKARSSGDPKAAKRAASLMRQASAAIEEREFADATASVEKAIRLLETNGERVPDLRKLSDAYLLAGVAYFRDGLEDDADAMLNKAVHYDPERQLKRDAYPPIFIRVFERARFNVLRRPRGRVHVKAAGGRVFLDGRKMGTTPLTLTDVLPGKHWLRIEQRGRAPFVRKLKVRSRKTQTVEFEGGRGASNGAIRAAIRSNDVDAATVAMLRRAGKKARAGHVLFGGVYPTSTSYRVRSLLLNVSTGKVGRLADVDFDLDMLTAEIEVYKLATDARKELGVRSFSRPVETDAGFAVAPKFAPKKRSPVGKSASKDSTVRAAPAPLKAPGSLYAKAAPTRAAPPRAVPEVKEVPKPTLVPKDEAELEERAMDLSPRTRLTLATKKDDDDDEGSLLWLWITLGVVAAGAAGTGVYFLANNDSPEEGTLNVRW